MSAHREEGYTLRFSFKTRAKIKRQYSPKFFSWLRLYHRYQEKKQEAKIIIQLLQQ
ncbi:hypothetical protein KIN20_017559 [Parelaphostrongylus tenuis]|uniref:Uncharacterized protein n=1 Tax=Parelaphostrongylus tenuis TaxID=148309 RepID=A0AAD5MLP4_PARTN|nr:hypothetical protein KIN20_017559 [Parelaphostrongylus tenuis]